MAEGATPSVSAWRLCFTREEREQEGTAGAGSMQWEGPTVPASCLAGL